MKNETVAPGHLRGAKTIVNIRIKESSVPIWKLDNESHWNAVHLAKSSKLLGHR